MKTSNDIQDLYDEIFRRAKERRISILRMILDMPEETQKRLLHLIPDIEKTIREQRT